MTRTVNRYLQDKAMDDIDHALGRPINPLKETYRDHYAAGIASPEAEAMRVSPHWREGVTNGTLTFFHVTDEGRKALSEHLKKIGDPHRLYSLKWHGHAITVVAPSRGRARYEGFLIVRNVYPDMKFTSFMRDLRSCVTVERPA